MLTFLSHLSKQKSYDRLRLAIYDEAPSRATAYNWFNELKHGRSNLTDYLRKGQPSIVITDDNISVVRRMIETDKRVAYQQITSGLRNGIDNLW
jgi:transposase